MSSTYGRKKKATAMAACRWRNLGKVTVQGFQVENRNLKDEETQTEISIPPSSAANPVSAAFLTAPNLPDVFCDKTVRPCESPVSAVSVNCPYEPEKLHCCI